MSHLALYRRYRSGRFDELIGQEHIVNVLKNQVRTHSSAHAYLFTGMRGTGKTSTARILARAVNCLDQLDGEPCGKCEGCKTTEGENVDIIEIDAASNTGVDDMRSLIERARFTPLKLRRKVYIIDEAHALTGGAFTALLKTLEEPPEHVMFILATTEPQKLPATIISRCQRFDFHRLSILEIVGHLKNVLADTGVAFDEEALDVIARAAEGSMRDALSLADQCVSMSETRVGVDDVYAILGSMDRSFLFSVADAIGAGDAKTLIGLTEKVVLDGRDLYVFLQELTRHIRALLVTKLCGSDARSVLDCTDDTMRRYIAQANNIGETLLRRAEDIFLKAQGDMRRMPQPRIALESALIRASRPDAGVQSIDALTARIEQLENKLKNGAVLAAAPAVGVAENGRPSADTPDAPPFDMPDTPNATAAPSPAAPPVHASDAPAPASAAELWQKAYKLLMQKDMSSAIMLRTNAGVAIVDGIFKVYAAKPLHITAFNNAKTKQNLVDCVKAAGFDGGVSVEMPPPVSEEALAKALGCKLEIED